MSQIHISKRCRQSSQRRSSSGRDANILVCVLRIHTLSIPSIVQLSYRFSDLHISSHWSVLIIVLSPRNGSRTRFRAGYVTHLRSSLAEIRPLLIRMRPPQGLRSGHYICKKTISKGAKYMLDFMPVTFVYLPFSDSPPIQLLFLVPYKQLKTT